MLLVIIVLGFFLLIAIFQASWDEDDDWEYFSKNWGRLANEEIRIRRIAREEIEENIPARYRIENLKPIGHTAQHSHETAKR